MPLLGVGFCLYLIYETGATTWLQFAVFLAVGLLVYSAYGRRHSRLARTSLSAEDAAERVPQEA
jgi:APA family basic amino acid/polyamine antiporter